MKIALTVDPEIPVPPLHYGGIERIIDMLIKNYQQMGHKVTLFANKDSAVPCELIPYPEKSSLGAWPTVKNTIHLTKHIVGQKFDVIHSFSRLAYLSFLLPCPIPKIMSYQREPTLSQIKKAAIIARKGTFVVTGCSNYITEQFADLVDSYTVYNGVPSAHYTFTEFVEEDAPLVFLGRIEDIKGVHIAIEVAHKTNKKLVIAGNIPEEKQSYFDDFIKPHLSERVIYIGAVNDAQKNKLLGNALALLMPIQWNEPFGIVMIEAMACGTPVIGFKRGSVPEVVQNGISGYICQTPVEMASAVERIREISRKNVRLAFEKHFESRRISNEYLKIYQTLCLKK